jgi:hypothetical protein
MKSLDTNKKGFIYILINPSLKNLLKIGMTTRSPEERAKELSTTGIPTPFFVAFSEEVSDCQIIEKEIHLQLENFRYSKNREFFEIPLTQAIKIIGKKIEDFEKIFKLKSSLKIFNSVFYLRGQPNLIKDIIFKIEEPIKDKDFVHKIILKLIQLYFSYQNLIVCQDQIHAYQLSLFSEDEFEQLEQSFFELPPTIDELNQIIELIIAAIARLAKNDIEDRYDEDILSAAIEEILTTGNGENKVNLLDWINFFPKENKSPFLSCNLNIESYVIGLMEKENDAEILYLSIFYLYSINVYWEGGSYESGYYWSEGIDYENMMWEFTLNLFKQENLAIVGNYFHKMIPMLGKINKNIIEETFVLLFTHKMDLDDEVLKNTLNAMSEADGLNEGFNWCEDKDLILEALIYLKNSYDDDDLIRLIKSLM